MVSYDTPIYLGGLDEDGVTIVLLENGVKEEISSLEYAVEEADERVLLHGHHAIGEYVEHTVIASSDIDVFVCTMYHFFKSFKQPDFLSYGCGVERVLITCSS